ncbi:hypothetical protein [Actinomadura sp. CNU-125]|uniref:hypothetical protein n=1 Tax=Actinomadura sp. CNU-125 TaxID=1904961 RepID=UPI0021CC5BCC|nr:hypothetical protein [Actinomadura sp. CNU-125]
MIDPVSGEHVEDRLRREPSAARLPLLSPGALAAEQRAVYEAVTGGPRGGRAPRSA